MLTSGAVQINTDVNLKAGDLKGLVMHELGHVLGLGLPTWPKWAGRRAACPNRRPSSAELWAT